MAKFYPVKLREKWASVFAIPMGIRRVGLGRFRLSNLVPFQSQKPLKFWLVVKYKSEENDDYREFSVRRVRIHNNGKTTSLIKEIHSENNKKNTLREAIADWEEHDDGILEYEIHFPRTSETERLIYSKPMDSNFVPATILGAIITIFVGGLAAWAYPIISAAFAVFFP